MQSDYKQPSQASQGKKDWYAAVMIKHKKIWHHTVSWKGYWVVSVVVPAVILVMVYYITKNMLHVFCPTADTNNTVNDNETDSLSHPGGTGNINYLYDSESSVGCCIYLLNLCIQKWKKRRYAVLIQWIPFRRFPLCGKEESCLMKWVYSRES